MVRVRVPASSANMGPGFDTLGLAVNVYNEYEFYEIDNGLEFEGIPDEFCTEENIIYQGMKKAFDFKGYKPSGIKIKVLKQDIPISRGLGSSSSCIVAGIIGGIALSGNSVIKEEVLDLAVELEGHPDNVAPAILGNMVVSIMNDGKPIYDIIKVDNGIKFVCLIPDFRLSTKEARQVIPQTVSLKDGIYNVSRAALLVTALINGKKDLLRYACDDKFHQNYRKNLIKNYDMVKEESYKLGALGFFLSGAGPTLMVMVDRENVEFANEMKKYFESNSINWGIKELEVDTEGAVVLERIN